MYDVKLAKKAEERFKKMDREIQKRFLKKIKKVARDPEVFGKPLRNELAGTWETYFENCFRIYYTIDKNREIINVETVVHKDET